MAEPAGNPSDQSAHNLLDSVNDVAVKDQGRTTPGASFKFHSVSDLCVGMRRSFARPIAAGHRGSQLRVRTSDRTFADGGPEHEHRSQDRGYGGPTVPLDKTAPAEEG